MGGLNYIGFWEDRPISEYVLDITYFAPFLNADDWVSVITVLAVVHRARNSTVRGRHPTARYHWIVWVAAAAVEGGQWKDSNVDRRGEPIATENKWAVYCVRRLCNNRLAIRIRLRFDSLMRPRYWGRNTGVSVTVTVTVCLLLEGISWNENFWKVLQQRENISTVSLISVENYRIFVKLLQMYL